MSLMRCPDCYNGNVSTNAESCPKCGNTNFRVKNGATEWRECYFCDGTGIKYRHTDPEKCDVCNGSGKRKFFEYTDLRKNKIYWDP